MKKVIIFDIDGSLINYQNIWKLLFDKCGYNTKNKLIQPNNDVFFDDAYKIFKENKLKYSDLYEVSKDIKLINGMKDFISKLYKSGYVLYIISANIIDTIELVLGEHVKFFEEIDATKLLFDDSGIFQTIVPAKYNYEGKINFVERLITQGVLKDNIIFIGNGNNDESSYKTGCKTFCFKRKLTNLEIKNNLESENKTRNNFYKKF